MTSYCHFHDLRFLAAHSNNDVVLVVITLSTLCKVIIDGRTFPWREEPCGRSDDWFAHNGTVSQFGQLCWETSGWEWGWLNWVAIHLLSLLNCRQEAITTIWERIDGGSLRLFANRIETIFCWRKHEIAVNVLNKCASQHFKTFQFLWQQRTTNLNSLSGFQEPSQRVVVGVFSFEGIATKRTLRSIENTKSIQDSGITHLFTGNIPHRTMVRKE